MSTGSFFEFHAKTVRGRRGQPAVQPPPDSSAVPALTVTELASRIGGVLRNGFPAAVWVKGEVSGYRGPQPSGHHYFSLKDAQSLINCVVWASEAAAIRFKWADGMEVLIHGTVAGYGARSQYQLKVSQLLPVGQGALELAFRQLKDKLEREGLFEADRKRPLPRFPRRIALITSRGAAGFADMLKVLRRFPAVQLSLFHVPVQGAAAYPAIVSAIEAINRHSASLGGIDAILLGRGGGSLEDLWAFNEEAVARAVAASEIPVITGIGHEVDVSIADLAADYHAHTPTEAAQVLTQHWKQADDLLTGATRQLFVRIRETLRGGQETVNAAVRHEAFRRPIDFFIRSRQQLLDGMQDTLQLRLRRRFDVTRQRIGELDGHLQAHRPSAVLAGMRERLDRAATRLAQRHPMHEIRRTRDRLIAIELRLVRATQVSIVGRRTALDALTRQLDAMGPLQVLRRGYSITLRLKDRQIIRDASEIRPGDRMLTRFATSEFEWTAGDGQLPLFS